MSQLASLFQKAASLAGSSPMVTASLGVEGAKLAAPMASSAFSDPVKDEAKSVVSILAAEEAASRRAQRTQMDMAMNTQRLAAADPQLYTEVMAGRRVATGSRVFGGQPRVDLMQQMALMMSRGAKGATNNGR